MHSLGLQVESLAQESLHLVALTRVGRVQEPGEATHNVIVLRCENNFLFVGVFRENLLIELEDSLAILKLFDQV